MPPRSSRKRKAAIPQPPPSVFDGMTFMISGKLSMNQAQLGKILKDAGASVNTSKPTHLVTNQADFDSNSTKVKKATDLSIPIVKEEFVHDCIKAGKVLDVKNYRLDSSGSSSTAPAPAPAPSPVKQPPPTPVKSTTVVKLVKKGNAVVDPLVALDKSSPLNPADWHVYSDSTGVYDAMLNQTDVAFGVKGHNKFYVVQVLEKDQGKQYVCFNRWGRVGVNGSSKVMFCSSADDAIRLFVSKWQSKTSNSWSDRKNFVPKKGKYTMIERDYNDGENEDSPAEPAAKKAKGKEEKGKEKGKENAKKEGGAVPSSKLDKPLQSLVQLICNMNMMTETMVEMEVDIRKMPLGKLSKAHIKKGYEALEDMLNAINAVPYNRQKLVDANNSFYTLIPHDFGFKKPPMISTAASVKKKMEMLESLAEIEIASKILKAADIDTDPIHPIDRSYNTLNCGLKTLDHKSDTFNMIQTYLKNTHGDTHHITLDIVDVFDVDRASETPRFSKYQKSNGRMLLWHGSRLSNFVGILSQGLRIAPPEAPVTGYMFGKGVYLADMVSKSANYCFASGRDDACLLLCETMIGEPHELLRADYRADIVCKKAKKLAIKGVGASYPDPKSDFVTDDGIVVPLGKPLKDQKKGSLMYNEFIVYNVDQIRLRYLVRVKVGHKYTY